MEHLLTAILRGEPVSWPPDEGPAQQARFLEATARHGVTPLVAHQLYGAQMLSRWPEELRESLRQAARQAVLTEVVLRRELQRVLSALAAAQVRPVLMKGAALAYLHYPDPCLRPRYDADLLIRKVDIVAVTRIMQELGYRRSPKTSGDLVMSQFEFVKEDRSRVLHAYDFHWKIANPTLFADLLSFEEVVTRSIGVPPLGEHARALGQIDALLLVCIHRVAHHHDSGKLLWLYDIHLLANGMDRQAGEQFAALAAQKGVRAVCARGLTLAQQWFNTKVAGDVMETLAARDSAEPSEVYLGGHLRKVDMLRSDLKALGGWSARWQLLREHLFPPPAYMRERYAVSSSLLLPALYAHRVVRGAWKWFRRPANGAN